MLAVSLCDRITNKEVRRQIKITDISRRIARLKCEQAEHINRRQDSRQDQSGVTTTYWKAKPGQAAYKMVPQPGEGH